MSREQEKFAFSFGLALLLHIALILGLGLETDKPSRSQRNLDVTLSQFQSRSAPDQARYLAANQQLGSGDSEEDKELQSRQRADFRSADSSEEAIRQQQQAQNPQALQQQRVARLGEGSQAAAQEQQSEHPLPGQDQQSQQSQRIASLEARLSHRQQESAKGPRTRRVQAMNTRRSIDAEYLYLWRNRIEDIGNRHYPAEARERNIEGELQLLVAVNAGGNIHRVEVLKSSGQPLLDRAAQHIVYLSAPFPPFPAELRRDTDVLEIVRTWRFAKSDLSARR